MTAPVHFEIAAEVFAEPTAGLVTDIHDFSIGLRPVWQGGNNEQPAYVIRWLAERGIVTKPARVGWERLSEALIDLADALEHKRPYAPAAKRR